MLPEGVRESSDQLEMEKLHFCHLGREGVGRQEKGETVDAAALLSFAENMEMIQEREENLMMHVRENFQSDF